MHVNLTPQAYDDLRAIHAWIAEDDQRAPDTVVGHILRGVTMFGKFPMIGRPVGSTTRASSLSPGRPYPIVHAITSETELDALTVLHTRRRHPPLDQHPKASQLTG